ncbi:hypothetical protein SLEP1_g14430 [Rubroshorea leprosula]|uniref:Uncharacterized protein n=1 Tax=Rubroshorea leprosula TaxID=152421 RepID=A0AAV5IPX9_9ROSI|nr:hypothetical protein SLEP1_g14430 [Rubroshorea leprosula]
MEVSYLLAMPLMHKDEALGADLVLKHRRSTRSHFTHTTPLMRELNEELDESFDKEELGVDEDVGFANSDANRVLQFQEDDAEPWFDDE